MFPILGRSLLGSSTHSTSISSSFTLNLSAGYATAVKGKGRKKPALTPAQLKDEALKKLLYPRLLGKPRINPSGIHRREVNRALRRVMRSAEAHETINRAWQLHKRQVRETREADLRVKWERMSHAMDTLKTLDKELYNIANTKVDPRGLLPDDAEEARALKGPANKFYMSRIQGLFPREMWIPKDTPSKDGWKYEFKAPPSISRSTTSS